MCDPKDIHRIEQGIAGMRHLAAGVAAFYSELVAQGLAVEQALTLTLGYLDGMQAAARPQTERKPDA